MIGYINGFEEKSGNYLTQKVLSNWDVQIIEFIVRHFYHIETKQLAKGVTQSDAEEKILKFWTELINKCSKETNGAEEIKLIKEAIHLINNFSRINEQISKNLISSFKYVVNSFETHYVVDYCERLINGTEHNELITSLISELFTQCVPTYPEDKIKQLLRYLKQNNEHEELDLILHAYLTKTKKSFAVEYISDIVKQG
ncbi:hypothetical protein [Paenibacillus urinalis]|uniref:hypothetical protein n=1 Tax=Paenibacillus urinalis TaxID=521520 RepID=UPI00195F5AA5